MDAFTTDAATLQATLALLRERCDTGEGQIDTKILPFQVAGEFHLLFTKAFFLALHRAVGAPDSSYKVICLDPDPIGYFHKHFGLFPMGDFRTEDDPGEILLALGKGPEGSPADAISSRGDMIALIPSNSKWLALALRDDDSLRIGFDSQSAVVTLMDELNRHGLRVEVLAQSRT